MQLVWLTLAIHTLCSSAHAQTSNDLAEYFSQLSCKELFSSVAPLSSKIPNKNWFPVCSNYLVWESGPKNLMRELVSLDLCESPQKGGKTEDRFADDYQSPSQKTLNYRPATEQEKAQIKKTAKGYETLLAPFCCGRENECLDAFQNIEIKFCEAQTDPAKSDDCIDDSEYEPNRFDSSAKVDPGRLKLAIYYDNDEKDFTQSPNAIIAHELGHACSSIQQKILAKRKDPDALSEIKRTTSGEPCVVSPATKRIYKNLFATGLSSLNAESVHCLMSLPSKKTRFHDRPCESACPRLQLEEAFAEVFSMIYSPAAAKNAEAITGGICEFVRDSRHPLPMDEFKCVLHTPEVLQKFETAVGCKK